MATQQAELNEQRLSAKNQKRKPYTHLACAHCKEKHLKCDGRKPTCTNCQQKRLDCRYREERNRRRESLTSRAQQKLEQELRDRIAQMKHEIEHWKGKYLTLKKVVVSRTDLELHFDSDDEVSPAPLRTRETRKRSYSLPEVPSTALLSPTSPSGIETPMRNITISPRQQPPVFRYVDADDASYSPTHDDMSPQLQGNPVSISYDDAESLDANTIDVSERSGLVKSETSTRFTRGLLAPRNPERRRCYSFGDVPPNQDVFAGSVFGPVIQQPPAPLDHPNFGFNLPVLAVQPLPPHGVNSPHSPHSQQLSPHSPHSPHNVPGQQSHSPRPHMQPHPLQVKQQPHLQHVSQISQQPQLQYQYQHVEMPFPLEEGHEGFTDENGHHVNNENTDGNVGNNAGGDGGNNVGLVMEAGGISEVGEEVMSDLDGLENEGFDGQYPGVPVGKFPLMPAMNSGKPLQRSSGQMGGGGGMGGMMGGSQGMMGGGPQMMGMPMNHMGGPMSGQMNGQMKPNGFGQMNSSGGMMGGGNMMGGGAGGMMSGHVGGMMPPMGGMMGGNISQMPMGHTQIPNGNMMSPMGGSGAMMSGQQGQQSPSVSRRPVQHQQHQHQQQLQQHLQQQHLQQQHQHLHQLQQQQMDSLANANNNFLMVDGTF